MPYIAPSIYVPLLLHLIVGRTKDDIKISVSGKSLSITKTLDVALRHVRKSTDPIVLWVDQICINQLDKSEKSEQVNVMDQIYHTAGEVLVWLGPAMDNSDD